MKVYVVYCHPRPTSFTGVARDRALSGLAAGGHEVRLSDLYAEGFDPTLSAWERTNHLAHPATKPAIAEYAENLQWCEALVLVYPTWWAGQPAMLKGWIDRVWVAGVAYDLPEGANRVRPRLQNIRRLVAITSHGSTKFVNALEGEAGKRLFARSLRVLCSRRARTTWLALYSIDRATDARRTEFLAKVERKMRTLR